MNAKKKEICIEPKRTNWAEIRKLRGAWKNMKIDPIEYQKKIRSEWDREWDKK